MNLTKQSEEWLWDLAFGQKQSIRQYSIAKKTTCGEDVVFVEQNVATEGGDGHKWGIYCLCDGHGGSEAAELTRLELRNILARRLPKQRPARHSGLSDWAKEIRKAVTDAFAELHTMFTENFGMGCNAGSTLTLALVFGCFLTVANVGDSDAVLDTGVLIKSMTETHRLEDCAHERERMKKSGVHLARLANDLEGPAAEGDKGLGPQRCWPGGLANSRSIGDLEAGEYVISSPHIKQCILPWTGARLTIASDGVWDVIEQRTACLATRYNCNKTAAERLVTLTIYRNNWTIHDDTTALIIDFLPNAEKDFPSISKTLRQKSRQKKKFTGSLLKCFCLAKPGVHEEEAVAEHPTLIPIADVDCATEEYIDTIRSSFDIHIQTSSDTSAFDRSVHD